MTRSGCPGYEDALLVDTTMAPEVAKAYVCRPANVQDHQRLRQTQVGQTF
jgi:hypothetical protein